MKPECQIAFEKFMDNEGRRLPYLPISKIEKEWAKDAFQAAYELREAEVERLREAISVALKTNGGPIDYVDTCDGKAYVMVEMDAFLKLEAALSTEEAKEK